jgi:hypothetical protein
LVRQGGGGCRGLDAADDARVIETLVGRWARYGKDSGDLEAEARSGRGELHSGQGPLDTVVGYPLRDLRRCRGDGRRTMGRKDEDKG